MTSLDKYLEIIKKGFSERENLMAMEPLRTIEEIAPLLDEKLTYKEFNNVAIKYYRFFYSLCLKV